MDVARLRQEEENGETVYEREACGQEERDTRTEVRGKSAENWPKDETDTEACTDEANALRPVFRLRDIGDVRLRRRDVPTRDAIDRTRDEEDPECAREPRHEERDSRPKHRYREDGATPNAIRQSPEDRRKDELHHGVDRDEEADHCRRCTEALRVQREHGNHDAEANEVNDDGREDDDARVETFHMSCVAAVAQWRVSHRSTRTRRRPRPKDGAWWRSTRQ